MSTDASADDLLPHLQISMTVSPSGARLALEGELEYATLPEFQVAMRRLVAEHPTLEFILDLQKLEFLDSSGVGALLTANAEAGTRGVRMVCIPGPSRVQRPLEVAGVDRILEFSDRDPDAA